MNTIKLNKFNLAVFALTFILAVPVIFADDAVISEQKLGEIENRVNNMSYEQLINRRADLLSQQASMQAGEAAGSASGGSLAIMAELSFIQKALIAIAGLGAVSALTDDGYDDNVPPVITIIGDNPATVELGTTYSDQGATAFDEFHGETAVSSSGTVDTSAVGTYTITYSATDLDGNTATATRTVNVVDTTAPVVTVTGDNPVTVELGTSYTDAGATATDASGVVEVVSSGTVDTSAVGSYTITYSSTDASGNEGTATRTVNVTDTTAPVFTSSSTFIVDENQTAVGTVTATDLQDVTFTISGDVLQITTSGVLSFITAPDFESQSSFEYDGSTMDFTATVTATDADGNAATQDITVQVRDVGGIDDNPNTGTGTGTGTGTVVFPSSTGTALSPTATGTVGTATGTVGTGTSTVATSSGTGTDTTTGVGTGTEGTGTGTQGTGTGTTGTGTGTGTGVN